MKLHSVILVLGVIAAGWLARDDVRWLCRVFVVAWLSIVDRGARTMTDGSIADKVVNRVVDLEGERWEQNVAADIKVAEGATSRHLVVLPQRIKGCT